MLTMHTVGVGQHTIHFNKSQAVRWAKGYIQPLIFEVCHLHTYMIMCTLCPLTPSLQTPSAWCNPVKSRSGAQHAAASAEGRIHNSITHAPQGQVSRTNSLQPAAVFLGRGLDAKVENIWALPANVFECLEWGKKNTDLRFLCKYGIKI